MLVDTAEEQSESEGANEGEERRKPGVVYGCNMAVGNVVQTSDSLPNLNSSCTANDTNTATAA